MITLNEEEKDMVYSFFNNSNGQLMILAAFRYCLGRRSYIVGSCQEWLTLWWNSIINLNTKQVIIRDIVQALMDNDAGDTTDYESWKNFASIAWKLFDENSKYFIKHSLSYKEKKWPFND